MHEHEFEEYVGIRVFGGTATAWVPVVHVENVGAFTNVDRAPHMQRCACGEQGYEVPA